MQTRHVRLCVVATALGFIGPTAAFARESHPQSSWRRSATTDRLLHLRAGIADTFTAPAADVPIPTVDGRAIRAAEDAQRSSGGRVTTVRSLPPATPRSVPPQTWSALPVEFVGRELQANGVTLLSDMPEVLQRNRDADEAMTGLVLGLNAETAVPSSQHDVVLGQLRSHRLLTCGRIKRWWMAPLWPGSPGEVPVETQFLLMEVKPGGPYAVLLPLVENDFRSTLYGTQGREQSKPLWTRNAVPADLLSLRAESGDGATTTTKVPSAVYVAAGRDPFETVERAFREVAAHLGTFRVRSDKPTPPLRNLFGWCTWDAFYSTVSPTGVTAGLESLAVGGTPARFLILDDGWQSVQSHEAEEEALAVAAAASAIDVATDEGATEADNNEEVTLSGTTLTGDVAAVAPSQDGSVMQLVQKLAANFYTKFVERASPDSWALRLWALLSNTVMRKPFLEFYNKCTDFTRRVTSFRANRKFDKPSAPFSGFVSSLKQRFKDLDLVYCWHALPGYWGGVSLVSHEMKSLNPLLHFPQPTPFVREVEPAIAWDPMYLGGIGAVPPEKSLPFYQGIHQYLAASGVDGVKVDAQSGLGIFGTGFGGGSTLVRKFMQSMERSVADSFGAQHCVNCMCHSTENLYNYRLTTLARCSDDFYPKDKASQTYHIAAVAFNTLFMGEVVHPDWDMFHSKHEAAGLHAAARAVGGCPVYTSDPPDSHDFGLLRKLVFPDGSVPVALQPGRPTLDCLFSDPSGLFEGTQRRGAAPATPAAQRANDASMAAAAADGASTSTHRALKVWNSNRFGHVVATFNLQGSSWDRKQRLYAVHDEVPPDVSSQVSPSDVPVWRVSQADEADRLVAAWSHQQQQIQLLYSNDDTVSATLKPGEWDVVTLTEVAEIGQQGTAWAPVGLADMLNSGGAVLRQTTDAETNSATVELMWGGRFVAWSSERPQEVWTTPVQDHANLPGLTVGARQPASFSYHDGTGLLEVDVAHEGSCLVEVSWATEAAW